MIDYEALAKDALAAIAEAGIDLPFERTVTTAFNPVSSAITSTTDSFTTKGVVLPATIQRFRGIDTKYADAANLVIAKARYLLLAAVNEAGEVIPEPLPGDVFTFHGATWSTVGCTQIKPANVPVIYQVGVVLTANE